MFQNAGELIVIQSAALGTYKQRKILIHVFQKLRTINNYQICGSVDLQNIKKILIILFHKFKRIKSCQNAGTVSKKNSSDTREGFVLLGSDAAFWAIRCRHFNGTFCLHLQSTKFPAESLL